MSDNLMFAVIYKSMCGRCNSSEYILKDKYLNVTPRKHTRMLPLTLKRTKPANKRSMQNHLLECNNHPSFGEFSVLTYRNKKYLHELKESPLIKRDKPMSNKNISFPVIFTYIIVIYQLKRHCYFCHRVHFTNLIF